MVTPIILDSLELEEDFLDFADFLISPNIEIEKPNQILSII